MSHFLMYLQDNLNTDGWYTDPDLKLQSNPLEISTIMRQKMHSILRKIKWKSSEIYSLWG